MKPIKAQVTSRRVTGKGISATRRPPVSVVGLEDLFLHDGFLTVDAVEHPDHSISLLSITVKVGLEFLIISPVDNLVGVFQFE
jgi:hypothetical protein